MNNIMYKFDNGLKLVLDKVDVLRAIINETVDSYEMIKAQIYGFVGYVNYSDEDLLYFIKKNTVDNCNKLDTDLLHRDVSESFIEACNGADYPIVTELTFTDDAVGSNENKVITYECYKCEEEFYGTNEKEAGVKKCQRCGATYCDKCEDFVICDGCDRRVCKSCLGGEQCKDCTYY